MKFIKIGLLFWVCLVLVACGQSESLSENPKQSNKKVERETSSDALMGSPPCAQTKKGCSPKDVNHTYQY